MFKQKFMNISAIAGQKDSFGDLVGTMGMPAPVQPTPVANGETKQEEIDISPGMSNTLINF
jgi:hypothetical protein